MLCGWKPREERGSSAGAGLRRIGKWLRDRRDSGGLRDHDDWGTWGSSPVRSTHLEAGGEGAGPEHPGPGGVVRALDVGGVACPPWRRAGPGRRPRGRGLQSEALVPLPERCVGPDCAPALVQSGVRRDREGGLRKEPEGRGAPRRGCEVKTGGGW